MLSLPIATLAVAVACWPTETGRGRLGRLYRRGAAPDRAPISPRGFDQRWFVPLIVLCAGLGALLAGAGGALAGALVSGTATARWRAGQDRRAAAAAATGLSDAVGMLVAELRAGAQPGDAISTAALEGHADAGRALSTAAAAARLGGDVPVALRRSATACLGPSLDRLAHAWSLAERYGIPLADLLDAVRADTEYRVRFAAEMQARLAGPRATAAVLAGLPLLGLALGQVMGAAPFQVLGGTTAGQVLLVVGTALACAGVFWSARLAAGAVPA